MSCIFKHAVPLAPAGEILHTRSAYNRKSARRHGRALHPPTRQARGAQERPRRAVQHRCLDWPRLHRPPGRVQAGRRSNVGARGAVHVVAGHHRRTLRAARPALWRRHRPPPRRQRRDPQAGISALPVVQVAGVCRRRVGLVSQVGAVRRRLRRGPRAQTPRVQIAAGQGREARAGAGADCPAARVHRNRLPPRRAHGVHAGIRLLQHDGAAVRDQGGRGRAGLRSRTARLGRQRDLANVQGLRARLVCHRAHRVGAHRRDHQCAPAVRRP